MGYLIGDVAMLGSSCQPPPPLPLVPNAHPATEENSKGVQDLEECDACLYLSGCMQSGIL